MADRVVDLGIVTAYAEAVSKGYTGTEAEFAEGLRKSAEYADNAQASATAASGYADDASGYATQASGYADNASASATDASGYADDASASATEASGYADDAQASAEQAEATLSSYAKVDGYYESMTVGNAEQLVTNLTDTESEPFTFRTAGGSLEIGDREELKVVGGSVVWNQLLNFTRSAGTYTWGGNPSTFECIKDHVYFITTDIQQLDVRIRNITEGIVGVGGKSVIYKASVTSSEYTIQFNGTSTADSKCMRSDLTRMFGSTIADYIYTLEQTTVGVGVAFFKKYFPKDYYAYNAGEMLHVQTSEFKTVGFNAWDEEWEVGGLSDTVGNPISDPDKIRSKNFCPMIGGVTYYVKAPQNIRVLFYDAENGFISETNNIMNATFTAPINCAYFKIRGTNAYGNTYHNDICINLHWDGTRDGEYEPYTEHSYPLDDSLTLRGIPKLDADNNLYYDGDTYEHDGTVTRKFGILDMGAVNWSYSTWGSANVFTHSIGDSVKNDGEILCAKYVTISATAVYQNQGDKVICLNQKYIRLIDSAYTDAQTFKTAMSGVYLIYELATPTTETADTYQTPQIVDNWGTEEFVVPTQSGVEVPVGHETVYPISLRDKLESAPNLPDGDGDYLLHMASGEATYKQLVSEFPSAPTTDGTYVLKATVSSGTATLTWVAE